VKFLAAILIGAALFIAVGFVLFFHYMSLGELSSFPPGGKVTVALSDDSDASRVMHDVCYEFPSEERAPTSRGDYDRLLAEGKLVQVPDRTLIIVHVREQPLTRFEFRSGRWKGKEGRACSGTVVLYHAYP
jgi:hypothetical protein